MFVRLYPDPGTSECSGEWTSATIAIAEAVPTPGAELIRNGAVLARVIATGDDLGWLVTDAGVAALCTDADEPEPKADLRDRIRCRLRATVAAFQDGDPDRESTELGKLDVLIREHARAERMRTAFRPWMVETDEAESGPHAAVARALIEGPEPITTSERDQRPSEAPPC